MPSRDRFRSIAIATGWLLLAGCSSASTPAPTASSPEAPTPRDEAGVVEVALPPPPAASADDAHPPAEPLRPERSSMLSRLASARRASATIETDLGFISCDLFRDRAPMTVANFVGLATGEKEWKSPRTGQWVHDPAYDGTSFHRVIPGFMIQGGDPKGDGSGEPGFTIADEIWPGAKHDRAGLLCMANRGKDTNGAQFFITDAAAPHLDSGYTIFGECRPLDVVHNIASAPRGSGDRPNQRIVIRRVTIDVE